MFWKKKKPTKPSREDIIKQANQSAQAKREEIGDEALNAIREAIIKKQNNPLAKAQKEIKDADMDKVLDNLSLWLRDKE